jgi:hypothetical protein
VCLTERRRRVCEDVRAKKEGPNPIRPLSRNFRKAWWCELRLADEWRIPSMIKAASCNQGNRTSMLSAISIRVNARM